MFKCHLHKGPGTLSFECWGQSLPTECPQSNFSYSHSLLLQGDYCFVHRSMVGGSYRGMQSMLGRCTVWWLKLCSGSWVKFTFSPLNHLPVPCLSFPSLQLETVVSLPMNPKKQLMWKGLYSQCVANKYCSTNHSVALHIIIYPP